MSLITNKRNLIILIIMVMMLHILAAPAMASDVSSVQQLDSQILDDLNVVSLGLIKVINQLNTTAEKEVISAIKYNIDAKIANPAFDHTAEIDTILGKYRALNQEQKNNLQDAILYNIPVQRLMRLAEYFGFIQDTEKEPDVDSINIDDININNSDTDNNNQGFMDIIGHWAAGEINTAVKLGIVSGISKTQFAPDRNITRAEFTALLTRAIELEDAVILQGRFTDVPADAWYFNEVNSAAMAGLVSGYRVSVFRPHDYITREQMTVIISRALAYKGKQADINTSSLSKFKDRGEISVWARQGASTAVQLGIVTGKTAETINPRENATRAEATAMILRMYNQI